jgi:uncharacterized membrane-anchored protein
MNPRLLTLPLMLVLSIFAYAHDPADSTEIYQKIYFHFIDSVNKAMVYSTGKIKPEDGHVMLNIPEGFKYLNKDQSKYVLTKVWNNPESSADEVIGMIFPADAGPFTDSSYAFVITYSEIGYVKDEDADKINYDDLMKNIQEEEKTENEKRTKAGYPTIHIVGWAEKPYYDKQKKTLHWAKEIEFGGEDGSHTLNYEIRILGRKGMLSLNAVGKMYNLPLVNQQISKVLDVASFTEGNSYIDFDPKIDKVAAWTIGGLVVGHLLAKAGILALIVKFLAPLWKFIVLAFAGLGAWFKKKLGRKKEENMEDYAVSTPEEGHPAGGESHSEGEGHAEEGRHEGGEGHAEEGHYGEGEIAE